MTEVVYTTRERGKKGGERGGVHHQRERKEGGERGFRVYTTREREERRV